MEKFKKMISNFRRKFAIISVRCQGQKVINHVVLAHKWFYAFMTRPNMRIKVGRMPHDIRIWGRIVKVRSTKQFVRHLLTSTSQ